jgi:hypothetical protein
MKSSNWDLELDILGEYLLWRLKNAFIVSVLELEILWGEFYKQGIE